MGILVLLENMGIGGAAQIIFIMMFGLEVSDMTIQKSKEALPIR
jgi:hypothetical protein